MKASQEMILKIANTIREAQHELKRLNGWTDAEIADANLARHIEELDQHLENAAGRASTIIMAIRLVKEPTATP